MVTHTHDGDRRRLLRALGATGLLAAFNPLLPAYARDRRASHLDTAAARVSGGAPRDVVMDIHVRRETIDIAGGRASAITLNRTTPGPILELWEGHNARLRVHNHLDESTSLHWHGLLLPFQMDGVPGVTFPGIDPGETYAVDFPVRQSGTYWYHSHSGLQEQLGQSGPIVIHPAADEEVTAGREYVIMLGDWTFEDPYRVLAKLKTLSDYYNFNERTLGDLVADVRRSGIKRTVEDRLAWGDMRMSARDIADVTGATYHYLMNGVNPDGNWTALFTAGERVRLRIINASAMTYFNVRIPGLAMQVVAADGQPVRPVDTDEFQIGVAETYDVIVEPAADRAYTIMAESMDRSGYARGTLAPREGMTAAVPALRAPPERTMIDMGMDMQMGGGEMDMIGPGGAGADDRLSTIAAEMHGMSTPQTMHGGHTASGMAAEAISPAMRDQGSTRGGMQHGPGMSGMGETSPVNGRHGPDHHGLGALSVAEVQRDRLGERGTGLADVPHRVLTYRQLRSVRPMQDRREPSRTIEVHLTGNMERYMWSFDGVTYSHATPIEFPYGERIRLVLVNDTMMEHPIHLHGMFMALENGQDDHLPLKHTLNVLPGSRACLLVTADEPGRWAFHCHLLFHMELGMFRVVRVSDRPENDHA